MASTLGRVVSSASRAVGSAASKLQKEVDVLDELDGDVRATVHRLSQEDPGLGALLKRAYGYAVLPEVGKASVVIGGAFGKGEVFERGRMIGYCALAQLTIGVQLGGETISEIVVFRDKAALERFKRSRVKFAAGASAVLVKAGATAASNYDDDVMVFVYADGGMMLEAAIGAQKFIYRPGFLGKLKKAPRRHNASDRAGKTKSRSVSAKRPTTTRRRGRRAATSQK